MAKTEDYINKLYDEAQGKQKKMLTDAYNVGNTALDQQQEQTQKQTDEYLGRTDVEAQKVEQNYKPANVSQNINAQASLTMENQQKKNTSTLQTQQKEADSEYQRLRKLYADQYAAEIKKAQANNDMERAQMLYEQAKIADQDLQKTYANAGAPKNKDLINQIYDSAMEAQNQESQMALTKQLSELDAKRKAQIAQTDRNLTQTYVDALKRGKNYNEVQNAYGLGSGNMAAAQLARDSKMTEDLTNLRKLQTAADAQIGKQIVEAQKNHADAIAAAAQDIETKRAQALYQESLNQESNKAAKKAAKAKTAGKSGSGGSGGSGTAGQPYDPKVLEEQKYLNSLGYKISEDGIDGEETAAARKDLEEKRGNYRVVNKNNADGVQVGTGGMRWDDLEVAIDAGTVKEVYDDENKTVHYVKA